MKIAFIVGQFPVASKTFILNQIIGLMDRGHEVDIYADVPAYQSSVHADIQNYNLYRNICYEYPLPSEFLARQVDKIKLLTHCLFKNPFAALSSLNAAKYGKQATSFKLLCRAAPAISRPSSYDIIHCHFGLNAIRGLLLKEVKALRGKLVTTFHGVDITKHLQVYGNDMYDQLWTKGDLFLPISDLFLKKIVNLGCQRDKTHVHHMGIDCSKFKFVSRHLSLERPVVLATVNRLVEKKGVEYAIRAVAQLINKNIPVQYNIIGEGPLMSDLQQLVKDLQMESNIHFLGWKEQGDVIDILETSDILIAPSVTSKNGDQEGIPVALMEAMAMGIPIVSTQHSGIPELVQNNSSGFLVPERNVDELANKLEYLAMNPNTWPEMGLAGRKIVERDYNIHHLNDQLVDIYQSLL